MRYFNSLKLTDFRNIKQSELQLHPRFNIIVGDNGSGKTSVLEAFYHLNTGQSFRSPTPSDVIRHGCDELTLFASTNDYQTVAISKNRGKKNKIKINDAFIHSASELAYFLPTQLVYQDIFQIIDSGPTIRRRLLDWALFYANRLYFTNWRRYKKNLMQRNALLKQKAARADFSHWDKQLIELGCSLHMDRMHYIEQLMPVFNSILNQLDIDELNDIAIEYKHGWGTSDFSDIDLKDVLNKAWRRDIQLGSTQFGAHKADILFKQSQYRAKKVLSRGQQKLILIAFKLAQSQLLAQPCLYLFDDIASELDATSLAKLLNLFKTMAGQFILTSLEHRDFGIEDKTMFHMKHGQIEVSRETQVESY